MSEEREKYLVEKARAKKLNWYQMIQRNKLAYDTINSRKELWRQWTERVAMFCLKREARALYLPIMLDFTRRFADNVAVTGWFAEPLIFTDGNIVNPKNMVATTRTFFGAYLSERFEPISWYAWQMANSRGVPKALELALILAGGTDRGIEAEENCQVTMPRDLFAKVVDCDIETHLPKNTSHITEELVVIWKSVKGIDSRGALASRLL